MTTILQVSYWAAEAHSKQKRVTGGAYINHPIRVARMLEKNLQPFPDDDIVKAALLHDVIEDTDWTEEDLITRMGMTGNRVIRWVNKLTDNPSLRGEAKHRHTYEKIKHSDPEVKLIKLADMIDNNLSYPPHWDKDEGRRIKHFQLRCFNLWIACSNTTEYLPMEFFKRSLLRCLLAGRETSQQELVQASLSSLDGNDNLAIDLFADAIGLASIEAENLKKGEYVYREPKRRKEETS